MLSVSRSKNCVKLNYALYVERALIKKKSLRDNWDHLSDITR